LTPEERKSILLARSDNREEKNRKIRKPTIPILELTEEKTDASNSGENGKQDKELHASKMPSMLGSEVHCVFQCHQILQRSPT
jgi:hypothetical protein